MSSEWNWWLIRLLVTLTLILIILDPPPPFLPLAHHLSFLAFSLSENPPHLLKTPLQICFASFLFTWPIFFYRNRKWNSLAHNCPIIHPPLSLSLTLFANNIPKSLMWFQRVISFTERMTCCGELNVTIRKSNFGVFGVRSSPIWRRRRRGEVQIDTCTYTCIPKRWGKSGLKKKKTIITETWKRPPPEKKRINRYPPLRCKRNFVWDAY